MQKVENPKTAKKFPMILVISAGIFLVLLAGLGIGYASYYKNKIYPGVYIAKYDVGGLTKDEAVNYVGKRVSYLKSTGLELDINGEVKEAKYEDLGISFDIVNSVEDAYEMARSGKSYQNIYDVAKLLVKNKEVNLRTVFAEDFSSKIDKIAADLVVKAQDANFKYENGKIVIVPEVEGSIIDYNTLENSIIALVNSQMIMQKIQVPNVVSSANIGTTDIEGYISILEKYIDKKIMYRYGSISYTPAKDVIAKWIGLEKKNESLKVKLSDDNISAYLATLAQKIDKKAVNKQVDTTGKVILEGSDGQVLEQDKALEATRKAFDNFDVSTITLVTKKVPKTELKVAAASENKGTPNLVDGKYIEVNLATQTMYLFEKDKQVASYVVSTGAWGTPTPVGERVISGKIARAWSATYRLYMPWWNDLGGGYGIHELPEWPGGYKEGQDHLGTPVSHGCIRLGIGAAEYVYNWAPIGTKVIIH